MPSIPEVYPQVLALPITRRPLFPGFYKAVTITSPPVIKAIRELLAHGQPYIGAFLLKDSSSDSDVITSMDQVYPVGVFAQITSIFESKDATAQAGGGKDGVSLPGEPKPETLTAVLYPHRRIHIDELVTQIGQTQQQPAVGQVVAEADSKESVPIEQLVAEAQKQETGDEAEVASFEEEVPSVEAVREELGTPPKDNDQPAEEEKGMSNR